MKNSGSFEDGLVPSKQLKHYQIEMNTSDIKKRHIKTWLINGTCFIFPP